MSDHRTDLEILVEYQDTLLRECNKAMFESLRIMDNSSNPYWMGPQKKTWDEDRKRHMVYLKNLLLRIRARVNEPT